MRQINTLDADQLDRLIDLSTNYLVDVKSGEVSGYGQNREDEIADVNAMIDTLMIMRGP